MCVFAGTAVMTRRATAAQGLAMEKELTTFSRLVDLRDALHTQQSLQAMRVRMAQLGVTPAVASQFIGVDLVAAMTTARARAEDAARVLGSRAPLDAVDLHALSQETDSGELGAAAALRRLDAFEDVADGTVKRTLNGLDLAGRAAHMGAPVAALVGVIDLEESGTSQGIDLSELWFPTPGATPASSDIVLARLAGSSAVYDATLADLSGLGVESVSARLRQIEADPAIRSFSQAVAEARAGKHFTLSRATAGRIAPVFRGYLSRNTMLQGVVTVAAAELRAEARHVATEGRNGFLVWGLGTAFLALCSIGIALLLGRSISRPLKQLASYAHAVNEGQLDDPPTVRLKQGTRETRLAFRAFGDLVASLRLLDAKANALAHCDFADPVLTATLPGRLGQSLESSVTVLSDSIMERDALQAHLTHQANHDSLTGLYNRPAALAGIQDALDRARRTGAATAALFIDLDEFKQVNDRHGHDVGDEVLRQIAARTSSTLRSGDFAARFGGDEFVVVAECTGDLEVAELGLRLLQVIGAPMQIGAASIVVGASIGIALSLDGPEEPAQLLARADAAMYRAKAHQGSCIELFDSQLQSELIRRVDIETALAAALVAPDSGGLRLCYQPIVEAATEALVGLEALVRWDRPGHGLLSPDAFIPIAETSDLIIDLDCWVLEQAVRQLAVWDTDPAFAGIPVSINVSGRHLLSRRLPGHLSSVLTRTGTLPHRLTVEITETVLLQDLFAAADELQAVRALGIKVAIDDFGTGYTSLAHLQQLPIDTIKIDRSFVSQLDAKRGRALVRMVTVFGKSMDINVIAEGVETDEELAILQAIGADQVQGYLLSRPLDPQALGIWATHTALTRTSSSA
jgi:diguanylate cyclase (GGDEF)-like protein